MTRAEIKGRIIKIIADKMYVNYNEINEESHFKYDIGVDSLDEVELIVEVEHKFGIEVSYEDTKDIVTIGDAIDAVCRKLGVPESPESGTTKAEQAALKAYPNSKGIRELKGLSARPIFTQGYEQAEKDLALTWIDFNKQKPPHGVPVLAYHHLWVNEDFNPSGIREGFLMDNLAADSDRCKIDFCSAYWWDYQDCYMTISKANIEGHEQEYSQEIRDSIFPEYWLPIPKFIKPE